MQRGGALVYKGNGGNPKRRQLSKGSLILYPELLAELNQHLISQKLGSED